MIIKERIKLGDTNYYIRCECIYKNKDNSIRLCLNNYDNDYYDGGDLSILIKKIEKNYNKEYIKKYDGMVWFLSECLYIYENIPFVSGVGCYTLSKDNIINSLSYVTKEELDDYIINGDINVKDNSNFKLWDERTWNVN